MLRHYCGAELDRFYPEPIEDCPICDTLAKDNRRCVATLQKACEFRDLAYAKGYGRTYILRELSRILEGL